MRRAEEIAEREAAAKLLRILAAKGAMKAEALRQSSGKAVDQDTFAWGAAGPAHDLRDGFKLPQFDHDHNEQKRARHARRCPAPRSLGRLIESLDSRA